MSSTLTSAQVRAGDDIHLAPHDVWRGSRQPHHVECITADVHVDDVIDDWVTIVVICWHVGPSRGATVYDREDVIERAA
jgi:hypothetical protein